MVLEPGEVEAIARAVVAQAAIGTAAGLVIGLVVGFLLNLKVVGPKVAALAERKVLHAMLDPEGAVQKARAKELEAFKGEVGDLKTLRAELEPLLRTVEIEEDGKKRQVNAVLLQLTNLVDAAEMIAAAATVDVLDAEGKPAKGLLGPNLPHLIDQTIKKSEDRLKMRKVRGEDTSAIESAMVEAEWAVANPEQAQALGAAHSAIDSLAPVFNWNDKKIKQLHAQAIDLARQGQNLKAFIDRLNGGSLLPGLGGVGGGARGGGGGFNPG